MAHNVISCRKIAKKQTIDLRLQHIIHIWKAKTLSYHLSSLETILVHPTRRQSFAGKLHSTFCNIWDLVISRNTKNSNLTGLDSDVNGYSWSDIAWEIICDVATEVKSRVKTKIYFHPHPTHQYTLNKDAIKTSNDCNIEYLMLQVIKKQEEEKEAEEKEDVVKVMREYRTLLRSWCSFSFETSVVLSDVLHRIFFTLFYSDLFFTSNDDIYIMMMCLSVCLSRKWALSPLSVCL